MKGHSRSRTRALLAAVTAAWLPVNVCRAGTTWDGGGANDNWSTANNWSPNGIPVNNGSAAIVFTGNAGTLPVLDIDWDISSLTFNSAAAPFNLGSANGSALTIGNVGILQSSTHSQFIGHTIILGAAQTWTSNPTSGTLAVNGNINTNGHTLTLNAGNDMFLQMPISGSGGLTKNGAGDVTLTASNTYTGLTTVGTGTLFLNSSIGNAVPGDLTIGNGSGTDFVTCLDDNQIVDAVGNTITLNDSGVLQLSSSTSDTVRDINIVGGEIQLGTGSTMFLFGTLSSTATSPQASVTGAGTLQMEGSKTFNIPDGTAPIDLDIDAVIAQASSGQTLTKTGAGTLRLGKANTFSGGLTVSGGTVILDNNAAAGTSGSTMTVANSTLATQVGVNIANFVEITAPATVLGSSAATVMTFSGLVFGSGSLTVDDADQAGVALKLSGSSFNLLSGTVTVKQGNLRLSKPSGFDAIAGDLVIGDGVGAALTAKVFQEASNQIKDTSDVTIKQDGYWFALPSSSETIASLTIDGGGQIGLGTGTLSPGGPVTVNLGDGTPALISNPVSLGGFNTGFNVASGAELILAGTVSNGGVIKSGAGTLRFSTSNSFTLGVTMNAGTIALDSGVTPLGTGTVNFASGSITPVTADRSISNPINLTGSGGTFDCGAFGLTVSGVISGSSSLGKIGTGLLKLTGANSYSGATFITAGTLSVGNNGLGAASSGTTVAAGATLQIAANYTNSEPLTLSGAGSASGGGGALVGNMPGAGGSFSGAISLAVSATIASIGAGDFTLRGNISTVALPLTFTGSSNTIVAAIISGPASVTKNGSGTLTLTSANTYTGATTVNAGKLLLQNNLTSSTSVSVSAGTLELASGGGHNRVIHTGPVSITGRIDLQDNKLITSSPIGTLGSGNTYNGMTGLIQSGRNGGTWNGTRGIVTSQTDATSGNFTSIGVATASQAKGIAQTATALWAGQTVTGSDTLVMYTYGGDANLDGKINVDDYGHIDSSIPIGLSGWFNGDFNYDGKINVDDYGIIDFNIGIQGPPFSSGGAGDALASVPEPSAGLADWVGSCAALVLSPRRRNRGNSLERPGTAPIR